MGEGMTGNWDWMFRQRKKRKLLNSLKGKARQNPQDCQMQVRLGDLLTKMGEEKAAIEAYLKAAEKFAHHGFIVEAIAISKIIMRLDPLQVAHWGPGKGQFRAPFPQLSSSPSQ